MIKLNKTIKNGQNTEKNKEVKNRMNFFKSKVIRK